MTYQWMDKDTRRAQGMKTIAQSMTIVFFITLTLCLGPAWAGNVTLPYTFTDGTPAVAAEVNANFIAVETAVDDNDTRISNNTTAISNNAGGISNNATAISGNTTAISNNATAIAGKQDQVTGQCPAGQSIRVIYADGSVDCEFDDIGSGGADGYSLDAADGDPIDAVFVDNNGDTIIGSSGTSTNMPCTTVTINDTISGLSGCVPGLMIGSQTGGYDTTAIWMGIDSSNYVNFGWLDSGDGYARISSTNVLSLNPSGGNVGVGTTAPTLKFYVQGTAGGSQAWQNLSDGRLKKNVKKLTNALSKVRQLQGVSFEWKADQTERHSPGKEKQIGFIAQDVKEIFPEVVGQDDAGHYTISYSLLVPVLVEALKEQELVIAELNKKVAELEQLRSDIREISRLKNELDDIRAKLSKQVAQLETKH